MAARIALIAALVLPILTDASVISTLDQVTGAYGLNEQYSFQFPTKEMNSADTDNYILQQWVVNSHGIQFGNDDLAFVNDPAKSSSNAKRATHDADTSASSSSTKSKKSQEATSSAPTPSQTGTVAATNATAASSGSSSTVLAVTYPQGSYSQGTGGAQFTAEPFHANSSASSPFSNVTTNGQFERMLLSYDVFFPDGFQFEQGGKLPGLRGGPDPTGCSGGHQSNGMQCFSTRLMWRTGQLGEVYAYFPPGGKGFCNRQFITCNNDFGTSIGRSTFSFTTGKWQTIWLYVELNQVGWSNGIVALWYNGVQSMYVDQLELRKTAAIDQIQGFFFSTFFGGYDSSWATPTTQQTYFRNIQMYGGLGASNSTGPRSDAAPAAPAPSAALLAFPIVLVGVLSAAAGFM